MLDWLYTAIAFVLKLWHSLYSTFLDPDAGVTWVLSIAFLVVTVRIIIFPLFVKQVRSQRSMQELQPEIAKLKQKFGKDRQGFSQAVMALQKERGVNPLGGCLPIVLQAPVFIALLHVLRRLHPDAEGLYSWSDQLTHSAASALVFGAPISSSFTMTDAKLESLLAIGANETSIKVVTLTLMIVMSITTFISQRMIMRKSGPVEGQAATVQKILLYVMPVGLFIGGFIFPLGVLTYWFFNNLWTMSQQFYILHKMPPPGSALAKKRAAEAEPDKPQIDPKALAPKPGARPNRRPTPSTPAVIDADADDGAGGNGSTNGSGSKDSATSASASNGSGSGKSGGGGGGGGNRPQNRANGKPSSGKRPSASGARRQPPRKKRR